MHILGLNLTQTTQCLSLMDGAAALVSDNGILGAIAEERLVRVKHAGCTARSVRYLLCASGLQLEDVDAFAVSICCDVPPTPAHARKVLADEGLQVPIEKVAVHSSHHLAHAASSYLTSPFEEALILVTDNEGNILDPVQPNYQANCNERTSYYMGRGREITLIDRDSIGPGDWGLGNVYGAGTQWFGYPSYQQAGQFMGATAYGDPERFRGVSLFAFDPQGHIISLVEPLTDKSLAMRRAVYRQTGEDIGWNHPESVQDPSQTQFDVAWLVQNELERAVVQRIRQLVRATGVKDLVVTGGVGLNCIMNKRLVDEAGIERIYVLPAPGDEGQSIGNALLFLFQHCRRADRGPFAIETPYLGREYSEAEMASALAAHAARLEEERLPLADLLGQAARHLAEGKIVCWFQGRSEFGPRALGNRSILADARRPEIKDILNRRVKHREPFRPFSPSVLAEAALEYFDTGHSPFMNVAARVRPEKRDRIPAVVHKDGTARIQTVRECDNPRYHALIRRYREITGIPLLLNTSFNQQEPIVETPGDAVLAFLKMDVDYLVLGDHLVKKREG